jgi:hypothetical protein
MTEPHTNTFFITLASIGVGLSMLFPTIDGNAVIGAFAGSSLVAISSKDLSFLKRFAYMLISLIAGCLAAPEVVTHTVLRESGLAAFFASAVAIPTALHLIGLIQKIDLPSILKKGK